MEPMKDVVKRYQEKLNVIPKLKGARCLREGVPSRMFFTLLAVEELFIDFLRDASLIKRTMFCDHCSKEMTLIHRKTRTDGAIWNCGKMVGGERCTRRRSIRYGSWYSGSRLTLEEATMLTYEILRKEPTSRIMQEYGFSSTTLADWNKYIEEVLVEYMLNQTEAIGGPNKIVEVDESNLEKRKFNRGHHVGYWVFGGIERESGKCFLVPVADRKAETLMEIMKEWIKPGTTIITTCWKRYSKLEEEGYTHLTVNHSLTFKDKESGAHANTIESTWSHMKANLQKSNKQSDFVNYLAEYTFKKVVKGRNEDIVNVFFEIVREMRWIK